MTPEAEVIEALGEKLVAAIYQANAVPKECRLIDREGLMQMLGVRSTTLAMITAQPDFPAAVKIKGGPLRWFVGEVADWLKEQRR